MDATDEPDLLHHGTETTAFLDNHPIELCKELSKIKQILGDKVANTPKQTVQVATEQKTHLAKDCIRRID
jgi:hypothetical protein